MSQRKRQNACADFQCRQKNPRCLNAAVLQGITTKVKFTRDHLIRLNNLQYRKTSVLEVTEVSGAIKTSWSAALIPPFNVLEISLLGFYEIIITFMGMFSFALSRMASLLWERQVLINWVLFN